MRSTPLSRSSSPGSPEPPQAAASERSLAAAAVASAPSEATMLCTAFGSSTSSSAASSSEREAAIISRAAACRCSTPARSGSSAWSAGIGSSLLEDDPQPSLAQRRIGDRASPQGVRQGDGPSVRADPDEHLVAAPAELHIVAIGEGQLERERGAPGPLGDPQWLALVQRTGRVQLPVQLLPEPPRAANPAPPLPAP